MLIIVGWSLLLLLIPCGVLLVGWRRNLLPEHPIPSSTEHTPAVE